MVSGKFQGFDGSKIKMNVSITRWPRLMISTYLSILICYSEAKRKIIFFMVDR